MQSLSTTTNADHNKLGCAEQLLSTVPLVMHAIRSEMRSHRPAGLSVPQFRTLNFIRRHEGASLSEVAEHLGLALPTVSRLTDALVKREFVTREVSSTDRRRAILRLTDGGASTLREAAQHARVRLAGMLKSLTPEEEAQVSEAMRLLYNVFSSDGAFEDG